MNKIDDLINDAFSAKKAYQDFSINRLEIVAKNSTGELCYTIMKEILNSYKIYINDAINNQNMLTDVRIDKKYNYLYPNKKYIDLILDVQEKELYKASILYNAINLRNKIVIIYSNEISNKEWMLKGNSKRYIFANELIRTLALYGVNSITNVVAEEGILVVTTSLFQLDDMIDKKNTLKRNKKLK